MARKHIHILLGVMGWGVLVILLGNVWKSWKITDDVCNTYPAMSAGYFHRRCECEGNIVRPDVPEYVDPIFFEDRCDGKIKRRYYVFDTNWPAVMEKMGSIEVRSGGEAKKTCTKAVEVLKEIYPSHGYESTFGDECMEAAEKVF